MLAYEPADGDILQARRPHVDMDRALRALRVGDTLVHLAPKAFDVLNYLFAHRDRVVPKSELLAELWPPGRSEHTLRQEIYALRRLLSGHSLGECIGTFSHYGYRFQIEALHGLVQNGQPPLNDFHHRALAATAHFERKADTQGWTRALFWYERLCSSPDARPSMRIGAVRAALHLVLRASISRDEAGIVARRHLSALLDGGLIRAQAVVLLAIGDALLDGRYPPALHSPEPSQTSSDLELFRSYVHLSAGDLERALLHSAASVRQAPEDLETHLHRGFMLLLSGDLEQAGSHFRFILQLQPDNADALEHWALTHLAGSRPDECVTIARQVQTPRGLALRCVAAAAMGDDSEAMLAFHLLERQKRSRYVCALLLGRCYEALNRPDDARAAYAKAAKDPASRWSNLEHRLWHHDIKGACVR